jgi:hypothetical protein
LRISKNFWGEEFIVSADHPELLEDISFTPMEAERTRCLVLYVLQPLRDYLDKPIIILSGKRSPELNTAIGGHPNSDHLYKPERKSIACDFTTEDLAKAYSYLDDHRNLFKMAYMDTAQNFIHLSGLDNLWGRGTLKIT